MKLLFTLLLVCYSLSYAQGDRYEKYRMVDTTTYRPVRSLYFYDLTIKESPNEGNAILEWKSQRNITYHMIEMRDPETDELIYRQKHYTNTAEFPSDGKFTIFPLYHRQKGTPISISLKEAKARNYKPVSTDSYYKALEKEQEIKDWEKQRATWIKENARRRKQAADERANRVTPKAFVLIVIVLVVAVIIVFGIGLVRYLTKDNEQVPARRGNDDHLWD
jgi:methionine aminopeptidase